MKIWEKHSLFFYYTSSLFLGLVFYAPVALLLRTTHGISYKEFFLLQITLSFTVFIGEIPSGKIVDKIGYKNSMIFSIFLLTVARCFFIFSYSFFMFFIEAILEGVSFCFISGTDCAYIYNIVGEGKFKSSKSKIDFFGSLGFIVSTLLFPILNIKFGLNGLIYPTILTTFLAFLSLIFIKKENKKAEIKSNSNFRLRDFKFDSIPLLIESSSISIAYLVVNFFYLNKVLKLNLSENFMSPLILTYTFLLLTKPILIKKYRVLNKSYLTFLISILLLGIYFINHCISLIFLVFIPLLLELLEIENSFEKNRFITKYGQDSNRAYILSTFNIFNDLFEIFFLLITTFFITNNSLSSFLILGIFFLGNSIYNFLISSK